MLQPRSNTTNKNASASLACASCAHCSLGNNKPTSDTTAAAKDNESPDSEKPVINFASSNNDFDGGFMFTAVATRRFTPSTKGATLLVDSGASKSFIDEELIPGLKERMREFKELSAPMEIITAGKHTIYGVGTGIISFTIRDSHGAQLPVKLRALVVPGLGRNIFATTVELKNGVRFVLEVGNPHLAIGGIIIPLKQDPQNQGMCSLDIMFYCNPQHELFGKPEGVSHDDVPGVVYAATADADIWRRRLGHMNPRSMELLRRKEGNGGVYTGTVSVCDICALSKSRQQAHPKKSTRTTTRPMQLIYTDLMGPFTPPAKGGYRYVSNSTDDYSHLKEVNLLRNKSEVAESLHQYNMTVAVPLGLRIEIVRCDKGCEYIGKEFKTLCVNAGINVVATNTPQQIGVSETDGQTLAQIIQCLMKDGNFPSSLWEELTFTATYWSNRSSHPVLGGATPYSRMHNKEADLSGLQAIGARAFVHCETYTRKLDDRAFEGKLCGFSQDSRAYRIHNPAKGMVVESRNVTFLNTPACSLPLGVTSEDYHYEGDVLRFTSALDGPLMAEGTFDGEDFCSAMEQEARTQRLRQEVRRLSRMNATYRVLPTSLQPLSDSPEVASDNSGVASPSIVPGTTGDPEDASPDAAPTAPATPAAGNAPTASRTGPRLEVTRASTKNRPNDEDTVDSSEVPRALFLAHTMQPDPSVLTFNQLLAIAAKASGFVIETERADFVHLDGDSFASSRAFVYATGAPAHRRILEEKNQPLKIANSYKDAVKSPQWKDWQGAIKKEMDSLKQHDVYKLVNISSVPKREKIIDSRFVFKQKADGRFKTRLVVQGHVQEPGIDYGRNYAPVCRIGSIRTLLAIACEHGWPVWQMDVVVAFLQSLIDKGVFV